ncbi:hypothetical protein FKW77_001946 [Venturia effusa]|uniref:CoA-binding domain-containing protein n=1 Tax=Venturia effusa TaxID=50376 RepID=A0A517L0V9_9PEZI|nr:hypothetical protein FKW77_001946 [Venturia effusa]
MGFNDDQQPRQSSALPISPTRVFPTTTCAISNCMTIDLDTTTTILPHFPHNPHYNPQMLSRVMEKSLKMFFSSPHFAVVGASSDPTKFGHKVFVWYLTHSLPVTPINPRSPTVSIRSKTYDTLASPSLLPNPSQTSLSIITPPKATLRVLKEAREVGVPAVWLQPGTYDGEVMEFARTWEEEDGAVIIGGMEGGTGGDEGWCVLVDGEVGLQEAGRKWERVRL